MSSAELPASAAVIGAGTMGLAAGVLFATRGIAVTIVVRRPEAADDMGGAVRRRIDRLRALDAITPAQADTAAVHIRPSIGMPAHETFELVYEAVGEDLGHKRDVLAHGEHALAETGVLVSTTSSLPVSELAVGLARPGRFAAWHWFHPADLVGLVEIVPGEATTPGVIDTLRGWSRALGKQPIVLRRDVPGFLANRLQYALLREAYALVENGVCDFADVDAAVTSGLGPRWASLGPFATMDLAGLDVHAAVAARLFGDLSNAAGLPDVLTRLRATGAGGAKQGTGLLGAYPAERLASLEHGRDRMLVALRDHDD